MFLDIIESVDSICRGSADMQYMIIQKKTQNAKLISLYKNVPFIFKCFHDKQHPHWCEKHKTVQYTTPPYPQYTTVHWRKKHQAVQYTTPPYISFHIKGM